MHQIGYEIFSVVNGDSENGVKLIIYTRRIINFEFKNIKVGVLLLSFKSLKSEAIHRMIIDHTHRLHVCIHDRGANKIKPTLFQILAERV